MKSQVHQEFPYTPEGLQEARKWAKKQGRLDELESGRSNDGYSQVYQCNLWYNNFNNNSNNQN